MVRALADNYNVALTADVPKRSRVVGLGIIMLARESGRPIMPFAMAPSRYIQLHNWDPTTINLPFGRGAIVGIEELHVPPDADAAVMEQCRQKLEVILNQATERAYELVGRPCADQTAAQAWQGGSGADRRTSRSDARRAPARPAGLDSRRQRRRGAG